MLAASLALLLMSSGPGRAEPPPLLLWDEGTPLSTEAPPEARREGLNAALEETLGEPATAEGLRAWAQQRRVQDHRARRDAHLEDFDRHLDAGRLRAAGVSLRLAQRSSAHLRGLGEPSPRLRSPRLRLLARELGWDWGLPLLAATLVFLGRTLTGRRRGADLDALPNPYTTGAPVRERALFFGREALTEELLGALSRGEAVCLEGERRIGKTSLLMQVSSAWEGRGGRAVYLDLEGCGDLGGDAALAEALRRAGAERGHTPRGLAVDLSSPERPLLIVLDEVDALRGHPEDELRSIRACFQGEDAPAVALMAGVGADLVALAGPGMPPIQARRVPPIDKESARALLHEPVREHLQVDPEVIDAGVVLAQGRPMRVQLIGLYLVERMNSLGRRRVRMEDLEAVRPRVDRSWAAIQEVRVRTPAPGATSDELERLLSEIRDLQRALEERA